MSSQVVQAKRIIFAKMRYQIAAFKNIGRQPMQINDTGLRNGTRVVSLGDIKCFEIIFFNGAADLD